MIRVVLSSLTPCTWNLIKDIFLLPATSLAAAHFAQYPMATIPGAVFSVWHNVSGAVLANLFVRQSERKQK